ncbi:MAG TPA: hypothetical protein VJS44_06080 [Pyrinomonadaceae bacterium]|nr:hypothetical protein [Pyrinomonadaceae bacterium]
MANAVLSYAVSANQDPIEVSPQTGNPSLVTIMIVVSNSGGSYVNCKSIKFSFLQGTNARDLFADPTGIETSAPTGWNITQDGSSFTATPATQQDGEIGPDGLAFVISNITVNQEPGTTEMTIIETTTSGVGSLDYPLAKFPAQFNVGPLIANPLTVQQGQSTTLSWNGSGGATYELQYLDASSKTVTITRTANGQPLPSTGSYTIQNLQASTVFYLIVTVTISGQDEPLIFQRWVPVSVAIPPVKINSFNASATSVNMPGDEVTFTWDVSNATQVQLNGENVEGNSATVEVDETDNYTLQALGQGGPVTSSIKVTVNHVTINSFMANPPVVYGKNNAVPVTLLWDVQSASQVLLDGDVVTGTSATVPVNTSSTFTLGANGYPQSVSQTLTVPVQAVNLKVWMDKENIYCSFYANPGSYTVLFTIFFKMSGFPGTFSNITVYNTSVSNPGQVQFSVSRSVLPDYMTITKVTVEVKGFSSGDISASYTP